MNLQKTPSNLIITLLLIVLGLPTIAFPQKAQTDKKPKLVVARPSIQKITLIAKAKAQQYYTEYKNRITNGNTRINPCAANTKDKFQYLRLVKNKIYSHIDIKDAELPEFSKWENKYHGIRIYPYTYDDKNSTHQYILAYTKENKYYVIKNGKQTTDKQHDDIADSYYLITVKGAINWCKLIEKSNLSILTSHHLCQPNCPDEKSVLLSF